MERYSLPAPKPGGEYYTTDVDRYVKAWRRIGNPLAKILGMRLMAFDPGFQFVSTHGSVITLDTQSAKHILKTYRANLRKKLRA